MGQDKTEARKTRLFYQKNLEEKTFDLGPRDE